MGYKLKRILIYPDGVTEKQVYPSSKWNGDLSKIGTPTTFTLSSPMVYCYSIQLSPTGDKLYVAGYIGDNTVGVMQQYSLSTPRDITTASLLNTINYGGTGRRGNYPQMLLGNNGQYLYFMDLPTNVNALIVYSLSTAWDISSTKTEITRYSGDIGPQWFSEDGKAFIYDLTGTGGSQAGFYYSTNNTAWDITYPGTYISTATPGSAKISTDGNYLYILANTKQITKYKMAIKRDPTSTLTQEQQVTLPNGGYGLYFDTEGNNLYSVNGKIIYQYSLV